MWQVLHVSGGTAGAAPRLLITPVVLGEDSAWRCPGLLAHQSFWRWRGVFGGAGGDGGEDRNETERGCQNSSLSPSSFTSSPVPPLLPKAGKRSKREDMKGIPEILFFFFSVPRLPLSLSYRYGNAESQIQYVPRLQRMPGLIPVPLSFPFFTFPSLPPRLTPSSLSASILLSCLSLAARGPAGR